MWSRPNVSLSFALVLAMTPAAAQVREPAFEFGVLTCNLASLPSAESQDTESRVGERRAIDCRFRVGLDGPDETYAGVLQFVGPASRVFEKGAVMFVAKAPLMQKVAPGLLHQQYTVSKLTEGGTQAPLVGEHDTSIVLHPLSHRYDQPTLALGSPPGFIVIIQLQLKAAPS